MPFRVKSNFDGGTRGGSYGFEIVSPLRWRNALGTYQAVDVGSQATKSTGKFLRWSGPSFDTRKAQFASSGGSDGSSANVESETE